VKTLIVVLALVSATQIPAAPFELNKQVHDGTSVQFIKHAGQSKWDNYLTLNLPFEPVAELFKQLLISEKKQLKNRGEAHITVVTPIEYWNVLRKKSVTIDEINEIAEIHHLQSSQFGVVCLGRGRAKIKDRQEATFFLVVKSNDLTNIRKHIQDLYIKKGGNPQDFNPTHYYPHITLGFTERDLHESDGVVKNKNSCVHPIKEISPS